MSNTWDWPALEFLKLFSCMWHTDGREKAAYGLWHRHACKQVVFHDIAKHVCHNINFCKTIGPCYWHVSCQSRPHTELTSCWGCRIKSVMADPATNHGLSERACHFYYQSRQMQIQVQNWVQALHAGSASGWGIIQMPATYHLWSFQVFNIPHE